MKDITLLLICVVYATCVVALNNCEDGEYFAPWSDPPECRPCGACKNGEYCNKEHQICPNGCEKWFVPEEFCWHFLQNYGSLVSLEHLSGGPQFRNVRHNGVIVKFEQNQEMIDCEFRDHYVYRVQYAKEQENFMDDTDPIPAASDKLLEKEVHLDSPNTLYRFRIVLYRVFKDEFDLLSSSAVSTIKTPCSEPVRPPTLQIEMLSLTSVRLTWPAPLPFSGCDNYRYAKVVLFTKETDGSYPADYYHIDTDSQSEIVINDLITGEMYWVRIQSKNNAGTLANGQDVQFSLTEANLQSAKKKSQAIIKDDKDTDSESLIIAAICIACVAILISLVNSVVILLLKRQMSTSPGKKSDDSIANPAYLEMRPPQYEELGTSNSVHQYAACN